MFSHFRFRHPSTRVCANLVFCYLDLSFVRVYGVPVFTGNFLWTWSTRNRDKRF